MSPGGNGEGRVYSAYPLGLKLRTKNGAAGITVVLPLLCIKGRHHLRRHLLRKLEDRETPSDRGHGPRLRDMVTDAALAQDPDAVILGPFNTSDADMKPLHVRKKIYFPAPFIGIFLERDITPAEACTHLCCDIIDRVKGVDCQPIID